MKRDDVRHALAIAARLRNGTHNVRDRIWAASELEREANEVQGKRPAHRPRKNDDLYLWMAFDKFLNDRTERDLKRRWNYSGQRTAGITREWLPRVTAMYATEKRGRAEWLTILEMHRRQRTRMYQK